MIGPIVDATQAIERISTTTLPELLTHYGIALSDQPAKTFTLMKYVLTNRTGTLEEIMPLVSVPRLAMAFLANQEKYAEFTGGLQLLPEALKQPRCPYSALKSAMLQKLLRVADLEASFFYAPVSNADLRLRVVDMDESTQTS